jgi:heptaprenyl diphosphate synthase
MSSAERAHGIAFAGALVGLAAVLGLVEAALLPPMPFPGVKLGLANIAVLLTFAEAGKRWALGVSLARVILVGAITGTLAGPAGLLSVSGACCAWLAVVLLQLTGDRFTIVGWSIGAATAHVGGQFVAASLLMGVVLPPQMAGAGLALAAVTGLAIGLVTSTIVSRLRAPLRSRSWRGAAGVRAGGSASGR